MTHKDSFEIDKELTSDADMITEMIAPHLVDSFFQMTALSFNFKSVKLA